MPIGLTRITRRRPTGTCDARPLPAGRAWRWLMTSFSAALLLLVVYPAASHAAFVYIDPGHGGPYSNANANGLREETVNLQISLALRDELRRRGHRVGMTRTSDRAVSLSDIPTWNWSDTYDWRVYADGITRYSSGVPRDDLQARCDKANLAGADIFISIHNNGSVNRSARGTETWASPKDAVGQRLSELVHTEIVKQTGLRDRGTGDMDFYVLRWSNMPAVLVEGAFITNPGDASLLRQAYFRRKIAHAIATGVDRLLAENPYKQVYPRLAGRDRYATAAQVSRAGWPTGAPKVIVAGGDRWPDTLAAAPLSRKLDAPLLLTMPESLPASTVAEIARLAPSEVVVLGGTEAVSELVASAIATAAGLPDTAVRRIAGADRYETAASIAREVGVPPTGTAAGTVTLVNGESLADALSIIPWAGRSGSPILLTESSRLPTAPAEFLAERADEVSATLVIGGPIAIEPSVITTMAAPSRLWGRNRYLTNVEVLKRFYASGGLSPYVISSYAYSDGIVVACHAARTGIPVLLTGGRVIDIRTREWITRNRPRIATFTVVGGSEVMPYLADRMLAKADKE